jgi:putative ABC transport system permease protein
MKTMLYGVDAIDPVTFAGVAGLLCMVAVLACWVPALRAARVDPIVVLRDE